MACFVDYAREKEIRRVYRPKKSMLQAPRQWWRYAILATVHEVRQEKRIDIWKLVSEKNEVVFEKLMNELPPIAMRNKQELEALRIEVALLRKENETLRKIVNDALEPSIRASPSKDAGKFEEFGAFSCSRSATHIGGSVTDRVRAFTENNDYEEVNRLVMMSRTTTNNSTIPTVDLENDQDDDDSHNESIIHHDHSSLSIKLRSLNEGSSESTALVPSPYTGPNESPFQKTQRISTMKRNMMTNNRLVSNRSPRGQHASPNSNRGMNNVESSPVNPADSPGDDNIDNSPQPPIQKYRRPTDIHKTRQRSTMAHVQRILRAAEIIMEKVEEEQLSPNKYENSEFDTSIPKPTVGKELPVVPAKLPLDERPLTREERSLRAQSVYSPRSAPSSSLSRLVDNETGKKKNRSSVSPRRSRKSRSPSPRSKQPQSRSKSKAQDNEMTGDADVVYPIVTPNLSPSQKVAIQIIKEVRFQGKRSNSPVANRPLGKAELTLLQSPFAKPILSARDRESLSPRTRYSAAKLKKGKVHDESAVSRVQTSKSK